ncbi:hypothetical protein KR032_007072 [Drosophila birchii]|nr:hypothetical protein KR032_007072 [Drosophila birchii]
MKAFTGLLAILLLGAIQCEEEEEQSRSGKKRSCLNFPGELYQRVRKSLPEDDSFVISPVGVSSLLGTLLFAVNETAGIEIANFLYPKCASSSEIAPRPKILQRQGSQITMATVALVRKWALMDKGFKENAAELGLHVFRTSFEDYKNDFNEFVFNKTNDRTFFAFEGLLSWTPDELTRLLFYNRLRFIAQFEQKFSLVNGNLFAPRVQALYADVPDLKAEVLGIPLLNTTAILLILLPNGGTKLSYVERKLRKVDVRKLPSRLKATTMDITLHDILEHKYIYLRDALQEAGISRVFNETGSPSEVSAFNGEVPLDNALVVADIHLNEDGINTDTSYFEKQKAVIREADTGTYPQFKALRNFIYAVVDSDRVYIMGRTLQKKKS